MPKELAKSQKRLDPLDGSDDSNSNDAIADDGSDSNNVEDGGGDCASGKENQSEEKAESSLPSQDLVRAETAVQRLRLLEEIAENGWIIDSHLVRSLLRIKTLKGEFTRGSFCFIPKKARIGFTNSWLVKRMEKESED